jgi:hypothetical protein
MANAIDAGKRLTLPYGKSRYWGQMRQRDAAMRSRVRRSRHQPQLSSPGLTLPYSHIFWLAGGIDENNESFQRGLNDRY